MDEHIKVVNFIDDMAIIYFTVRLKDMNTVIELESKPATSLTEMLI